MKRENAKRESEVAALKARVAALEAEQRQHRATLYSIGDAVLATDAAGRVTQMNPVAESLTGWSEAEARGRPAAEVFRILSEDTREPVPSPVERVLREGRVVGLGNHTLLVARDGTERPVADSGAPIRDEHGEVTGVVLVFRDQTEERAAQRQLEEAEERFRTFFDDAPVGKSMTAPDGRLLRLNAAFAEMLGYTKEELQRLAFADITHPDDVAESQECVRCLLAGERADWTMERRYLARDGAVVWTLVNTRLQRDLAGAPLRFLTHIIDITEQKTAQLALRERVKELTCLQALSDIVERAGSSADEILAQTVRTLPGSWLHPDCAVACIRLDDQRHETGPMDECVAVQRAELRVDERGRGAVEVGYLKPRPAQDEGPFLREERALIDALTELLGRVIERLEAKESLQESEERFRRLAENAPDMIYRMSLPDGAYEYVSPAAERITGYPPEFFLERPLLIRELLHPDFHEFFRKQWERLLAGEAPPTYELAILDREGRTRWLNQRHVLLTDAEGRPTAIEGVVTDVTDRRQAQQEMERSNQDFQHLYESMAQGVVYQAPDGRITQANPAAERILGLTLEQMRGRTSKDPRWRACRADGSELPGDEHPSMVALRTGLPASARMGVFHPEEEQYRWIQVHAIPEIRAGEARPYRVFTTFQDITELLRSEEELRETERGYRELFENSTVGIFRCDFEGVLRAVNPTLARILGYDSTAELASQGAEFDKQLCTDEGERRALFQQLERTGQVDSLEIPARGRDGRPIWLSLSARIAERDPEGRHVIEGFVNDISRRNEQQAQIAELERQYHQSQRLETIGQLAGGVAHDFNNLLTVINSYTGFALAELDEQSPLREDLQQVLGAGKRASDLTRQLLAFSRKQVLKPKILDLNEVVAGLDRMLERVIGEDVTIRTRLSEGLGRVSADPAQLEQVLMNLVVNARDAMPRGGTLTITTANVQLDEKAACRHPDGHPDGQAGRYAVLSVADTGEGMDAETRERVFEPFFTTKTKDRGTGLGLATVYGIVRQSEGAIEVESQPGEGTTFRIFLPRVEQDPHPTPRFDRVATELQGSETILVVEDEEAVRKLTARILESAGYRVLTAADGHQAIRICEQEGQQFDLLLSDVVMPELSGREVAERLIRLAARAGASFRVLFMSGYTDNAIAMHGVLDEDTALLAKPFTVPDLLQAVRRVLDGDPVGPTHDSPANPAPTGASRKDP